MSATVLTISVKGIPPDGRDVAGSVSLSGLLGDWHDPRVQCPGDLEYRLHVSFVRGGVLVQGQAGSDLLGQCDRCLEAFPFRIHVGDICHFFPAPEGEELDLTAEVREDTLLAFPNRLVCRENCRGLCPVCGQDLNIEDCGCRPRQQADGGWASLEGLDLS